MTYKSTVHVVEDDPAVNESLRFLLQAFGYPVLAYYDAESFFEAAPPLAGDLVIVDLGLPQIDGTGVIKWVERRSPASRIVAISGQSQRLIDKAVGDCRSLTVLRKPLTSEILETVLA